MPVRLKREIEKLKARLLTMSAKIEESVHLAVKSVEESDRTLAERVIAGDEEIDKLEVDTEEECLKILALYQPVAIDLRYIIAVLKINNDLERIGDLAVNIAERGLQLCERERVAPPLNLSSMAEKAQIMLRKSLDALVNLDAVSAREVCAADQEIDDIHRNMYCLIEEAVAKTPASFQSFILLLGISRNLERIADHATNIAEDVIYLTSGEIIRHGIG
ncbi:MAG: phosphate signaling complex protein PhoU [Myxococcota bacterium]